MDQLQPSFKSTLRAIIILGLIVGTLDILSAIVDYYIATRKGPSNIFKYIASAILDKQAFSGSTRIIVLGLFMHYLIAFLFTTLFVVLYRNARFMTGNKLIVGLCYGVLIGVIMNFIVVPLSLTPKAPYQGLKVVKAFLILICIIGLPLAFLAPLFLTEKK
jgi:hypothetical protein